VRRLRPRLASKLSIPWLINVTAMLTINITTDKPSNTSSDFNIILLLWKAVAAE